MFLSLVPPSCCERHTHFAPPVWKLSGSFGELTYQSCVLRILKGYFENVKLQVSFKRQNPIRNLKGIRGGGEEGCIPFYFLHFFYNTVK